MRRKSDRLKLDDDLRNFPQIKSLQMNRTSMRIFLKLAGKRIEKDGKQLVYVSMDGKRIPLIANQRIEDEQVLLDDSK